MTAMRRKTHEAVHRSSAWIDIMQAPDALFFEGLVDAFNDVRFDLTVRKKGRTVSLAETIGFEYEVIGRDFDSLTLRKLGIPLRTCQLVLRAPQCDVSLSSRNAMCILASKARRMPSIHFTDNDITAHVNGLRIEELYNRLEAAATHTVVPAAFDTSILTSRGAAPESVHTYDGYKEDVYVASFEPDSAFLDNLPFEEYVVVRPEALSAAYVDATESIVPPLLAELVDHDINVVYLSRNRGDERYADPYPQDQVFSPAGALHGLQLAWHAQCVLTGSGTMGREAAAMNKPAVSFFPSALLSVDQQLVADGRMYHSRDPVDIAEYVASLESQEIAPDLERSRATRKEVVDLTAKLIHSSASE